MQRAVFAQVLRGLFEALGRAASQCGARGGELAFQGRGPRQRQGAGGIFSRKTLFEVGDGAVQRGEVDLVGQIIVQLAGIACARVMRQARGAIAFFRAVQRLPCFLQAGPGGVQILQHGADQSWMASAISSSPVSTAVRPRRRSRVS